MNILETHVLEIIGENTSSPDVFTDTDAGLEPIRESLNDAIDEISIITGSIRERYLLTLIANQAFYRMKLNRGSSAWIADAWLADEKRRLIQTDLIPLEKLNPHWLKTSGNPSFYFTVGPDILGLYPVPSGNSVVDLSLIVTPERLTSSTDRIRLKSSFQQTAVYYAVADFFASRGDVQEAAIWHQRYLHDLGLINLYPQSQERFYHAQTTKDFNHPKP